MFTLIQHTSTEPPMTAERGESALGTGTDGLPWPCHWPVV